MASKRTAKRKEQGEAVNHAGGAAASGGPVTLALPADFRIGAQAAFKQELLGALAHEAIALDGGAVERVDTSALQMLVVFQREREAAGRAAQWQAASAPLAEAADLLGLAGTLRLPVPGRD